MTVIAKFMECGLEMTGPQRPLCIVGPIDLIFAAGIVRGRVRFLFDQLGQPIVRALPL